MRSFWKSSDIGFTLIEMMIALALGAFVLGVAVQLFSRGMALTWLVGQRAELQQDARASFGLVTKDISMANAGLSDTPFYAGIALATGGAKNPIFGCDYTNVCHLGPNNNAGFQYPVDSNGLNYLYGVVPGWQDGPTINVAAGASDAVTLVYTDTTFLLDDYQVEFNDTNGNSVTFQLPAVAPNPAPQAVNNAAVGLQQGDLVLFQNATAGVIGEVTAPVPAGGGPSYVVSFGNASPLGFNQNTATSGNLRNVIISGNVGSFLPNVTATRIWAVTYYIDNSRPVPTLMRLVNGRLPIPVAENVADFRLTYDTYDASGTLLNALGDGGLSKVPSISPNSIRTINLLHLTVRSQASGAFYGATGYQSIDLHSSISARNMGFINRYQ